MEQISSAPSSVRAGSWVDSGIRSNEWTIRQGDAFTVYRLPTLEKIREFSAPNSAKGAQRAMFLSSGDILLNSTYWGAILKRFTPGSPVATEEQPPVPHRALLRMAQMNESQFVVFDPLSATMISLENHGSVWSALSSGTQVFGNWTAVRTDPREGRMRATLTGKAKADGDLKVLIALPPGETYSQEIKNERFISGSAMRYDRFGNRLLEITIPVRAGEEKNIELYSGDITRYSISVDLNAFRASISDFDTPTNANLFLADHTTYALHDPTVEAKRNELRNGTNDYLELLRRTMIYSNSIPYKSDGRFDPAPVVIRQNHGACTEHTFVTVSILRGAGIPARYVWNYLGTEQPELNHKIAEAWLPGFGWIPMEVLAPPGRVPGTTYAHHIIWAVYDQWASSLLRGGDTLFNISGVPVESGIVRWSLETETARERSTQTIRSRSFQVQERSVVE